MKNFFLAIFIGILLVVESVSAATVSSTTGFVPGQIWYSKDKLVAGDTIKIYTIVWNAGPDPLSARVEFYDKNVILGTRDVTVEKEMVQQVSIGWKVTAGDHTISAKIISSAVTTSGMKEDILLENRTTAEDQKFVPVNTQNSNIKNQSYPATTHPTLSITRNRIKDALPVNIQQPILRLFDVTNNFRLNVYARIRTLEAQTKKKIEVLSETHTNIGNTDGTVKPIARVTLFLLSIARFFFASLFVFYLASILLFFFLLRFIYEKLKNR